MRVRDAVTAVAGVGATASSVLLIGGATRWAQAIVGAFALVALAAQLPSRRVLARISPLVAVLGVASALTVLQLLPLPSAIVSALQPMGASLREDGAGLLDLSTWSSLSIDPPATLRALSFLLILFGVAIVSLRLAFSERARYWMIAAVAGTCGLTALFVGLHVIFGARDLYGLYELREARPSVLGPLLNENHLGCLMAMGTVLSIGLTLHRMQRAWVRSAWFVVAAACATTTAASQSRGAIVALIIGCIITGGVVLAQRLSTDAQRTKRRQSLIVSSLPIAVVAGCAIVVMVYASAGGVSDQLSRTTFAEVNQPKSKFSAWKSGAELVEEAPWIGVGRGAQESAFTRVHAASAFATYAYVENEYVQAVVDWGVPGALLLAAAGLWLIAFAVRRWNDGALSAGALGALAIVLSQSNIDFGVELLGIAVPTTIVVACLTYVPLRETTRALRTRAHRLAHLAVLALASLALLTNATKTLDEDHVHLRSLASPTIDDVRENLERHPLDYYGYALASQIYARQGDPRAAVLLNHALRLHPTHPGLHLTAARLLHRSGRHEQAAIEYATALRGTNDSRKVVEEIVQVFPTELAATAIPTDFQPIDTMIIFLEELRRIDVALAWLDRVALLNQNSIQACQLLYSLALQTRNLDAVTNTIKRCPSYEPPHDSQLQLGKLLFERAAYDKVILLLADSEVWQGHIADKTAAWLLVCDSYSALRRWDDARRCLRRLDATGYLTDKREAEIVRRIDQINLDRRADDLKRSP